MTRDADLLGPRRRAERPGLEILFEDVAAPVVVPDCPLFLRALKAAAPKWPFRVGPTGRPPIASVVQVGERYELRMAGEEPIRATAVSAACGIMVDVIEAKIDAEPARICFHCGSVEFAGRLVVFPSPARAGKSTLVARLAASGQRIFGDDVLPLSRDDLKGLGTGMAPRLRLPLPAGASDAFRTFVAERTAVQDGRYLYLALDEERLARRHEAMPLGAVVLLNRTPDGPAFLSQAKRALVLRRLILQNFAQEGRASDLLGRTHALMDRLPAFALHYSDVEEAAVLLTSTFRNWPPEARTLPADDHRAEIAPCDEPAARPAIDLPLLEEPYHRFRRAAGIGRRSVEGEIFLAKGEDGPIQHLNQLGSAIWSLLDEPMSAAEMQAVLREAFPDVDSRRIEADVALLFAALLAARLIEGCD